MSSRVLLRYELSNRGLFSEILNMINGYYYAEEKGWDFQLITDKERSRLHFSTGDYTYYFKKFWKDPLPDSDYEKIYHCYDIDETFRIIHKSVRISVAQKRALTQRIIRLQPAIAGKINAIISQLKLPPPPDMFVFTSDEETNSRNTAHKSPRQNAMKPRHISTQPGNISTRIRWNASTFARMIIVPWAKLKQSLRQGVGCSLSASRLKTDSQGSIAWKPASIFLPTI